MSIFKGKEIRLLMKRVDNNERRLKQLECEHTEIAFEDYQQSKSYPWCGADMRCTDCGKLIRHFDNINEFLKAKHEIMDKIIAEDLVRIGEIKKSK